MEQSTQDRAETRTGLFVGGEPRQTDDVFPVHDPADPETVVGHAAAATTEQAQEAVRAAHDAFPAWAELGARRRAELVVAALDGLPDDHDARVELLSRENGKVRGESDIDLHVMAGRFRLAAELADEVDAVRTLDGPPLRTTIARLPLGVVVDHRAVQLAAGDPRRVAAPRARGRQHDRGQGPADHAARVRANARADRRGPSGRGAERRQRARRGARPGC